MDSKTKKLVLTAVWAALGFVLTPIFRIPGYAAPMQHLINVSGVVLLGRIRFRMLCAFNRYEACYYGRGICFQSREGL